MRLFKTLSILLILSLVSCFWSCSDSSTSNNNPVTNSYEKYLPIKKGNWWKWENYKIDSVGNPIQSTTTYDSTVVVKQDTLIAGKNASVYIYYGSNGSIDFIRNYCLYGSQIFMHSDGINYFFDQINKQASINLPFKISNQWIVLADFEKTTWTVYDTSFKNIQIKSGINVDITFKIEGQKGTTKDITVENKTYKAQEFKLVISGEFNLTNVPTIKKSYQLVVHYWFAENGGKLLYTFDLASINFFDIEKLQVGGDESKVIKMFIQ